MEQELHESERIRLEKVAAIRARNENPYAYHFERTHSLGQVMREYEKVATGDAPQGLVRIAGRLTTLRGHGKTAFAHISDQNDKLQVYLKADKLGAERMKTLLHDLDLGDIVGVEGSLFRTRTGELTVEVAEFTLLTKSILPPPEKFHGLKDVEIRYRQRYLDLMSNPEVRQSFVLRSRILSEIRKFFESLSFLEVETPILQAIAGGASARPFITHHNALNMPLFLRIAPELYLKRLLVGGFERVFEMNRNFRNEGISIKHNPEFTMVECYQAYTDGSGMMDLTEKLIAHVAQACLGTLQVQYQDALLDFSSGWPRIPMEKAVLEIGGIDINALDEPAWAKALPGISPKDRSKMTRGALLEALFAQHVEEKLIQPTFITDYPLEISPLAKPKAGVAGIADRFELFVYGRELANGFSELNDPMDQKMRFEEQLRARDGGDDEAHMMDEDFVTALKHGMPPAGGMGLGVDRLVMALSNASSIRDVLLFPLMRQEKQGASAILESENQ
jgi:lysyl-tRNA synthetase class 2